MTSLRKFMPIDDLRLEGQAIYKCFPVCSSGVAHHAFVSGDAAKVCSMTSLLDIGEETITGASREGVL